MLPKGGIISLQAVSSGIVNNLKYKVMKTIHVKLIVTVVLMVAVFAAAGQPARGNKNVKKENTGVVRKSETGPKNARSTVDTRKVREINRRDRKSVV